MGLLVYPEKGEFSYTHLFFSSLVDAGFQEDIYDDAAYPFGTSQLKVETAFNQIIGCITLCGIPLTACFGQFMLHISVLANG